MAVYRVWSGSGVTEFAVNTAYTTGQRIVPAIADSGTNFGVARAWVWECTTAGTSDAALNPTWPASVTKDTTTVTSGTATFTARQPGISSGTTVDWTFASPFFTYADSMVQADGDVVFVHKTHLESIAAATTWAFAFHCGILCVDKDSSEALSEMSPASYYIGHTTTARPITFDPAVGKKLYAYGLSLRTASTATNANIAFGNTGARSAMITLERCYVYIGSTGSTSLVRLGYNNDGATGTVRLVDCTVRFSQRQQKFSISAGVELIGVTLDSAGTKIDALFDVPSVTGASSVFAIGCDFSWAGNTGGNYIMYWPVAGNANVTLENCKLASGWSPASITTEPGNGAITVINSDAGDVHYAYVFANGYGTLSATTAVYANDGPTYDASNHFSWRIDTTASCSPTSPFITPWFGKHNDTTGSAVTPYFEVAAAVGDTYNWKDTDIAGQFSAQVTSGSTRATISTDAASTKTLVLGDAGTDQTDGAASWTGTSGAWTGKIEAPASVTPQEVGPLLARAVVMKASATIYVDPYLRAA